MTRHKTAWWSFVFPTPPQRLLRQPAGKQIVNVLTEWWTSLEGFADGTWLSVDHSRRAAEGRYSRATFYALLDSVGFPVLPDSDEHAVDKIFDGFEGWTVSRKARKLVERLANDLSPASAEQGQDVHSRTPNNAQHGVRQHVAEQVHHHVHAHVHHAVSHAAHNAGHGAGGHIGGHGGHGGGGHGGGGHH